MNLAQLGYFSKMAELEHYSQAAKALNIAQPSLSSSIALLEKEVGVPLFRKVGRGVRLTKYGAEFLTYVNAALEQIDTGVALMHKYAGDSVGGKVDLGCIVTLESNYIPSLITSYKRVENSSVTFNVSEGPSLPLLKGLEEEMYDVAFLAKDFENKSDMTYTPVVAQRIIVGMSRQCPLIGKDAVTLSDLTDSDIITYKDDIPLGASIRKMLQSAGITSVEYSYNDEAILAGFAASGVKPVILLDTPLTHTAKNLVTKELFADAENMAPLYHRVYFAYDGRKRHPYSVDCFIRYVNEECQLIDPAPNAIYID